MWLQGGFPRTVYLVTRVVDLLGVKCRVVLTSGALSRIAQLIRHFLCLLLSCSVERLA